MGRPSQTLKGQLGPSERTAEGVMLFYWQLEPPRRPLSVVTDHIVYDRIVMRVVLYESYLDKSPFFISRTNHSLLWAVGAAGSGLSCAGHLQVAFTWPSGVFAPDSDGSEHYLK